MKKILKPFGFLLLSFILILIISSSYIAFSDIPSYEIEKIEYHSTISPQAIERGKKLSLMLCANCHMNRETGKLTGKLMLDGPPEFGRIYSQNITQDTKYGIGNYTDAELVYLLRTGINKEGRYTPPYMAKLPNMADEDINAIIAFLHSNDPMVIANDTPDRPCEPSFLTKLLCRVAFKPYPMPKEKIKMPNEENELELGKYLAQNLECFSCHSSDFKTNNYLQPELSEGYFAGGNKTLNMEGQVMLTANLTPDKETGIGNWSKEKFIKALKYGIKEGESALMYPMMPYTQLSDYEAGAIFEYLQTIPKIKNEVPRSSYN